MKTKIKLYKNNACVTIERNQTNGMYTVLSRNPDGTVNDKVSTDDMQNANAYFKSFCKIVSKL